MNKSPLKFFGGKTRIADWIVSHLPKDIKFYGEVFAGGLSPLFARDPNGSIEVVNDIWWELTNFWRVLQSDSLFREFQRLCEVTPFSEVEFDAAKPIPVEVFGDSVVSAWHFFIRNRMSFSGSGSSFPPTTKRTRRGINENVASWLSVVDKLPEFHRRLRFVEVRRMDFRLFLAAYDSPDATFYCFHPDNQVRLENEELKPISEIVKGDRLFGNKLVINSCSKPYLGKMLSIDIQGLCDPLRVTPDHIIPRIPKRSHPRQETRTDEELWNSLEEIPASELRDGDYLLIPIGGVQKTPEFELHQDINKLAPREKRIVFNPKSSFFRLLGYYAAEGHLQRSQKSRSLSSVILSFGSHELTTCVSDASNCCQTAFGIAAKIRRGPHDSVTQVYIHSKTIANLIANLIPGIAPTKHLHDELMTAPIELQKELLIGWLAGDGGIEYQKRNRVKLLGSSVSKKLAQQMYQIALRLGLKPSLKLRGGRIYDVYFASEDAKKLGYSVPAKKFRSSRRIINGNILTRVNNVTSKDYQGDVFDITVSGNGLFSAPFALVHNCDPPYLKHTRTAGKYTHDLKDEDHADLLAILEKIKGRFILSGYPSEMYDTWAKRNGFQSISIEVPKDMSASKSKPRGIETIWRNFT